MKLKVFTSLLVATSLAFASVGQAVACTVLMYFDASGKAYVGRTIEFSYSLPTTLTYFPSGTTVESFTPDNKKGKTFTTK